MLELPKNKRILVVAAHPDDEVLGGGASFHRLAKEYDCDIKAIILGEGLTSRSKSRERDKWSKDLDVHKENVFKARKIIGFSEVKLFDLPDNRFDQVDLLDIIKIIEAEKSIFKPDIIFTHHGGDLNIDHQRTFDAVMTSTRPVEGESVKTILSFRIPSSTEWQAFNKIPFLPNCFIAVEEENMIAKIQAMECYDFEKREYPHPRSSESLMALAKHTGTIINHSFAESFILIRSIY